MDWQGLAIYAVAFLLSLTVHECAHAWTAARLGDLTGAALGRVSLNPIRHIDPFGTIVLPLVLWWASHGAVMFGYAKPVPYNAYALRNPPLGSATIAAAGPLSNLALAVAAAISLGALTPHASEIPWGVFDPFNAHSPIRWPSLGQQLFYTVMYLNVLLACLNLVPCPPLDGGTVLAGLLPAGARRAFAQVERYGFIIFLALMYTGMLNRLLGPVVAAVQSQLLHLGGIRRG